MVGSATNLSSMEFHIVRTVAAALACLEAARLAARVSDGKRIRGVVPEMRYTNWHLFNKNSLPDNETVTLIGCPLNTDKLVGLRRRQTATADDIVLHVT